MVKTKAVTTTSATPGPAPKGQKPDMLGVPGELVSVEGLNLQFSKTGHHSPYDILLDNLALATEAALAAQKERPALRFADARAKASVGIRAKKKGLRMTFAEHGGNLYARIEGWIDEDVKGSRRERLLVELKRQPGATTMDLCRFLREKGDGTIDKQMTEAILTQMQRAGEVVHGEGDQWRLNPAAKALGQGGGR